MYTLLKTDLGSHMCCFFTQTDDKGVFCTTLSQEYLLGSRKLVLTREQLWELSYTSIDFIFADEEVRVVVLW